MPAGRARRSRSGCLTCRKRKIKCDETPSKCKQCVSHGFSCEWPLCRPTRSAQKPAQSRVRGHGRLLVETCPSPQPSPSSLYIQCANSLVLSHRDRLFLEYFPSSTVYSLYDFFEWGVLQYLVRVVSPRSKLLTRMMLALSAGEMQSGGHPRGDVSSEGLYHYTRALQGLRVEIARPDSGERLDGKLAALILMVYYELQFTGCVERVAVHLQGMWSLIHNNQLLQKSHQKPGQDASDNPDTQLVVSCQLIAWALNLDIASTTLGASSSLLKLIQHSGSPELQLPRLLRISRHGAVRLWGKPTAGLVPAADAELYRPVEMGWRVLSLRFDIWHLGKGGKLRCDTAAGAAGSIWNQLMLVREDYLDILHLADDAPMGPWTPFAEVITRFACFFWATVIYHRHVLGLAAFPHVPHALAISKLISLLVYRHEQGMNLGKQSRVVWCTYIACRETFDLGQRGWLLERLEETRHVSVECERLYLAAHHGQAGWHLWDEQVILY